MGRSDQFIFSYYRVFVHGHEFFTAYVRVVRVLSVWLVNGRIDDFFSRGVNGFVQHDMLETYTGRFFIIMAFVFLEAITGWIKDSPLPDLPPIFPISQTTLPRRARDENGWE